jgi:F420-dependent oxidoreductase-like protein
VRVCMMIEGQEGVTWDEWVALARAAEDAGLDGLFRSDHYTSFHGPPAGALDAWSTLAALAPLTSRIRLGTLVSPATFRHPSVLARTVVTVDHVSGGRAEVGIGTGWFEQEHVQNGFPFPDTKARFDLLEDYTEVVVRSWSEDSLDHEGKYFTLHGQRALPRPVQSPHPPVILGGGARPRAAALAARLAQEYNVSFLPAEQCRQRRAVLDRACTDLARDPGQLALSLMTLAAIGDDRADARDRLGRALQLFPARAEACLVGTVDEVADQLRAYERAGVSRVFLQHPDRRDMRAIALMGQLAQAVASRPE